MTQSPKQWATTGFIIGVASGVAAVLVFVFLMRTGPQAVAAPAPVSNSRISGTIELDAAAASRVTVPTIVFVIARAEGAREHPVLAKRLDVQSFPIPFTLGPEDSMMGQIPSGHLELEARVDRDGDAMTREAGAPAGQLPSIQLGNSNLRLVLR